jgi:hypothetical protein
MSGLPLRPMSAGEILDGSFQLYRRHFAVFFLTAMAAYAPVALVYAATGMQQWLLDPDAGAVAGALAAVLLMGVATSVAWAGIAVQFGSAVSGEPVRVSAGLRRGVLALLPLFGLALLMYLLLFALMAPAFLITGAAAVAVGMVLSGSVVATVVTFILMGVGMAAVLFWWGSIAALTLPALAIERRGPIGAIKRAFTLAKGARMRIVGLSLLAWLIIMLPTLGTLTMFGMASTLWDPAAVVTLTTTQLYVQHVSTTLVNALTTPYVVGVLVLLYYDRRVRREGYDVELAAAALSSTSA